jgi:hypothetical protein
MNVLEVSGIGAAAPSLEHRIDAALRGFERNEPNERNEIVSIIRAAVRETGLPKGQAELDSGANEMQIAFDRESRKYVVRLLDRATQEIVRQIPAEDVLSRARYFVETSQRMAAQSGKR